MPARQTLRVRRLLLLAVALVLVAPQAAWAHGDEGELEVVEATPDDTGSAVTYRVRLTYANDGDPVGGATVTATASTVGEAPLAPVTFTPAADGVHEGTVAFPSPGDWSVRFESLDPEAGLTVSFTVAEPPPPTTAPPPTEPSAPPTSTDSTPSLADEGADDEGPPTGLIVGLVVSGLLVVGAGVALVVRRRRG